MCEREAGELAAMCDDYSAHLLRGYDDSPVNDITVTHAKTTCGSEGEGAVEDQEKQKQWLLRYGAMCGIESALPDSNIHSC